MLRSALIVSGFLAFMLSATSAAEAANNCQRSTGGKCKAGQTAAPNKTKQSAVTKKKTRNPPTSSNRKGRDDYSAADRQKMMERAQQLCSKEFGRPSRVYRIDYKQGRVWCTPASY
ncbi:MAG: hypothetical protein IOC82_06240 [Aestuariivirga sp.]|uniref:hypothetical protein n=1 Tax=Aestuariivirga sp. TaxID=2650926 RepID=UPI0025C6CD14|nr:hypothetical protein [Aestuariivirga sp.]MCA3560614.1 hypothetical protein [Aestuariivirga sp.]